MVTFSVIILVIVLIAIQHLLNWLWRSALKNKKLVEISAITTIISIPLSYLIILTIIKWGQPLIK